MPFDEFSFVLRGRNRYKILNALMAEKLTSVQLSKMLNIPSSNIARNVVELREKNLIRPLTNARKFKFYAITAKGKRTLVEVERIKSMLES